MNLSRFDIAIIGDSLAARMAAALLARHGKRLLLLSTGGNPDPWRYSSLFVERLAAALGGRDQLTAPRPFQVLSAHARVTVCGNLPLQHELAREFGSAAPAVGALLDELERLGSLLEEVLWEHGGLPGDGVRERAAWRWLCLRRKLPPAALSGSLADRMRAIPEPAAEWLRDLFQGLALQPLDGLAVMTAALLWAQVRRPEGIDAQAFDDLLHKRLEQFHGTVLRHGKLDSLEFGHGQWAGRLPDGGRFQAGQLILGDLAAELPASSPLPLPRFTATIRHFTASGLDGRVSPLLEERVIAGGVWPLRMTLVPTPAGLTGVVGTGSRCDEAEVRRQLEPLLPFARLTLTPLGTGPHGPGIPAAPAPSLFKLPLRLGSHLWCADDVRLAPHLGSGGAALIAWTLARHLDPAAAIRN